ncbi:MAG: hypothetical protein AB1421_07665 [Pseudomonadota bacterium]
MLTNRYVLMLMTLSLGATCGLAAAQGSPDSSTVANGATAPIGCHPLMTQKECSTFLTTLARLEAGDTLQGFLDTHFALMRERESACDLSRQQVASRRSRINPNNSLTRQF